MLCYNLSILKMAKLGRKIRGFFSMLGPGVVAGAADDDPSGIATYTQAGAQFGYGQLWVVLLTLPLLTAVQEACARIGIVTGRGLAAAIKHHYSSKVLYGAVALMLVANTINIGANLGAMGAAAKLLIPAPFSILTLFFTAVILFLEIYTSYKVYARILKWFALALLAYPVTVFLVDQPWLTILRATFVPNLEFSFAFIFIITGVIGTTISPYMFFWEASQEVEEERDKGLIRSGTAYPTKGFMRRMRLDNFLGMLSSQAVAWCVIVVGATVLHAGGVTDVRTTADAARALAPLVSTFPNAGLLAQGIFAFGVIVLGLLAVPVLSASASYALSETLNWKAGLNMKFKKAHGFYGIITIATLVGLMINFVGIDPIKALIFSAVFNGVAAVPLIFLVARMAQREDIMGEHRSKKLSRFFVWTAFLLVTTAAVAMFYALWKG